MQAPPLSPEDRPKSDNVSIKHGYTLYSMNCSRYLIFNVVEAARRWYAKHQSFTNLDH